jgi:metallophosphoesterase (TIGR00282 family)
MMAVSVRILFIGDVVGPTGRAALLAWAPELRRETRADAVIVNGENAADEGFGLTPTSAELLLSVADFVTLGDHAFDREEIGPLLEHEPRIIRPANMGADRLGRGWSSFEAGSVRIGVVNLMGRVFMKETPETPFAAVDRALPALATAGARVVLVDLQAEATSEKQAMGWYLDGRVAGVLGTHTHVPTSDLRILPAGTAYVSDIGMTGARDGIIGFSRDSFSRAFGLGPSDAPKWPPAPGERPARLDGVLLELDATHGRAVAIERVYREDA